MKVFWFNTLILVLEIRRKGGVRRIKKYSGKTRVNTESQKNRKKKENTFIGNISSPMRYNQEGKTSLKKMA